MAQSAAYQGIPGAHSWGIQPVSPLIEGETSMATIKQRIGRDAQQAYRVTIRYRGVAGLAGVGMWDYSLGNACPMLLLGRRSS